MWNQGRSLEQQVKMFESFFNMAPDILCLVNFEGAITKVNPSFTKALGYNEAEFCATSLLSFVHPFDLPIVEEKLSRMVLEREPQQFEARFVCKDGAVRVLSWTSMPDHDSRSISCAARDVTQARRTERELRQTMAAIDNSAIVAVTDVSGHIMDINENFCKVMGYSRDELIGKTHNFLYPDLTQEFIENVRNTLVAGTVWQGQLVSRSKSGDPITTHTVIMPIAGLDGQIERFLSIRFDLTQQVKIKAALEIERSKSVQSTKMATLGELASGIAHEINNPLSVIMLTATMLPALAGQPDQLEAKTAVIEKACDRIAKIVNGLRKYSRISDTKSTGDFAVSYLVQEALSLTENKARRHAVEVQVSSETTAKVHCNEIEIEQVIVNLVNNAIDAIKSKEEPRWIKISVHEDANEVVLRIRDCGLGIAKDVAEKLFQPFFTTKAVGEGTGLGLSIVKNILNNHRARIEILTDDPHTCFEIRFPKCQEGSSAA